MSNYIGNITKNNKYGKNAFLKGILQEGIVSHGYSTSEWAEAQPRQQYKFGR